MTTSATSRITGMIQTERRFVYHIPSINVYRVFRALSKMDAQQQFMNSTAAPYYRQAVLLSPDD